jgi:hypothetical protein
MTKKDYEAMAAAVRDARARIINVEDASQIDAMLDGTAYAMEHIADVLARDNPRFDRARFLTACGVAS